MNEDPYRTAVRLLSDDDRETLRCLEAELRLIRRQMVMEGYQLGIGITKNPLLP